MTSKKKTDLTAREFIEQLKSNAEYNAGVDALKAHAARVAEQARPLVAQIVALGYPLDSLNDLPLKYSPLPREVVETLLRWLGEVTEVSIQHHIVRLLADVEESFDVRTLTELFERTESTDLQWAIANTIAQLRPLDAREWVVRTLRDRRYGRSREMLPLALARIASPAEANQVIRDVFDEMPGHAAIGLAESGGAAELDFLRSRAKVEKGWVKREMLKAARQIEDRLTLPRKRPS